jgi:putative DNA primase/helicase
MDAEGAVTRVKQAFSPNIQREREVLNALKNLILVDATLEAPAWLPGADAEQREHDPADIFSFHNGLFDLRTEELLPHSRAFLSLNTVNYDHDLEAKCPDWETFVHQVFPDVDEEDMRVTLQQMFGYFISNDTRQQKIFANLGRRRSGKGTTAFIIEHLLGPANVTNPDLENIQQHFGLESLIGKRLAIIGDARLPRGGDTSRLSGRLLMLSGGDAIGIPRKGIADWNGRLNIRIVINANLPPSFADDSGVIADRFIILRFRQSFAGKEDHGLRDRLAQELPGIFNWALRGLNSLREAGRFTQPASSEEMISMMRNATNPIFPFMEDNIVLDRNSEASRDAVGARYRRWAEDNGHKPMSLTKLTLQLNNASEGEITDARIGSRGSRERVFRGCRLLEEAGAKVIELSGARDRRLSRLGVA